MLGRSAHGAPLKVAAALTLALIAGVGLTACASSETEPIATAAPTITPKPAESAGPPVINLAGTAVQNLPFFEETINKLLATTPDPAGADIIKALAAAGYPKNIMEITPDKTAVNLDADNIQFSLRLGKTCLIGQTGNVEFTAIAAPILASGTCLFGKTAPVE